MSVINSLVDSVVSCSRCGAVESCDCWELCECGHMKGRGDACSNPECELAIAALLDNMKILECTELQHGKLYLILHLLSGEHQIVGCSRDIGIDKYACLCESAAACKKHVAKIAGSTLSWHPVRDN